MIIPLFYCRKGEYNMKININTECRNCKELQSFIEDVCKIRKEYNQNHTRDSLDCTLNVTVKNQKGE